MRNGNHLIPSGLEPLVDGIFAAVNSEFKDITLLAFGTRPMRGSDLADEVLDLVDNNATIPTRESTYTGYIDSSLLPVGFVERIEQEDQVFSLSERGQSIGQPIAAQAIIYAVDSGRSMYSILGSCHLSRHTRAPINRVKILLALGYSSEPRTVMDLSREVELTDTIVSTSINELSANGFISCEDNPNGNTEHRYRVSSVLPERVQLSEKGLWIVSYLLGVGSRYVLEKEIIEKLPLVGVCIPPIELHEELERLTCERVLARKEGIPFTLQRKLTLSEVGWGYLERFIIPVLDALTSDEALKKLQRQHQDLMGDRELRRHYFISGANMYADVSPVLNHRHPRKRVDDMLDAMSTYEGGIGPGELARHLGWRSRTVGGFLRTLHEDGVIEKITDRDVVLYREKQGQRFRIRQQYN